MEPQSVTDEFGRSTVFRGEKLAEEDTDTLLGNKPQWMAITIWRTEARQWVVRRTTHYRVRHLTDRCSRAEGYELVDPTEIDTYPCGECNQHEVIEPGRGLAQASRIQVDVYPTAAELIESLKAPEGSKLPYTNLSRSLLSDLAEQDLEIDDLWNTQVIA